MWILYAAGSALFAGVTSILAKCGIRKTDSNVATAVRTIVVLLFSWLMVFIVGSQNTITEIGTRTFLFLVLSGLATGASWLCYFRALQLGSINKVVPIDKSSTVLTVILAFLFLHEEITAAKGIGILGIGIGTYLMIQKKAETTEKQEADSAAGRASDRRVERAFTPAAVRKKGGRAWIIYAFLSAIFASLQAILGKVGITGVESNLGTAVRTGVVLIMAWIVVFVTKKQNTVKQISKRELFFICLSGIATGGSWLCYYKALQDGPASVVVPIDKLSILVTIAFSGIVFHEKLNKKSAAGLVLIALGTLAMVL